MALGRYTTDLEPGDVLGPLEYTMSKFVVREYCHANELHQDCYQGADPAFLDAASFTQFLKADMPRWAKAVKDSGTKLD